MTALLTSDAELWELRAQLLTTPWRHIVVLTGAGISVASGLPTYRGPGGLWTQPGMEELPDAAMLTREPSRIWALLGSLRTHVRAASANPAHLALAAWEARCQEGQFFTLLTQNVDGLHRRAGSRNVIELHGNLLRTRCTNPACALPPFEDSAEYPQVPLCTACGAPLRLDITLFDEPLPVDAEWAAKKALRECELFLAVGTSGTVSPASNFVRSAKYAGAKTILVNLTPMQPRHPDFDIEVLGHAEHILPLLIGDGERCALDE
ncbi:Sir2 family NAD-dependent protein deacetylase [Vitiosangium sp. GDMCC 1.1324]|uniref:SIR2 family NAD-dependent protein deacylase n=1 Tax=Vitiosangium sp. (strain GDMCC 1.1324) TaxID=2138576 RepID=UPI000D3C5D44|nr:Sir2 family NAD-dependent protein deacetylase [Vitiosangium sp. GDMCC 1.1324]PTL76211.1 Sir2 family transcriptional regulator [Vitiosangium sp. GDMCC 1.1324]